MESFSHKPVMVAEVLAALRVRPGGTYVDGTIGGAGHAEAILNASAPDGRLYGCDRDERAVAAAQARLAGFARRVEIRHGLYSELGNWIAPALCQGVLLDLGVSSPQLDAAERGFSFQQDGPLDMRMDSRQAVTAARLVNEASVEELARWFWELGGERQSTRIARAIERQRAQSAIETTGQLAALVERVNPRRGSRIHPATRVFQALRMVVNDELAILKAGLQVVWSLLAPEGRLAVITFQSLEDRIVKSFGRDLVCEYRVPGEVDVPELRQPKAPEARWVLRKPVAASAEEVEENPRSRSAHLRVLEKI